MATASLVSWLRFAGVRDSAGAAVSSGLAYFYQPGSTTVPIVVYSDAAATAVKSQPVTLDAAGCAEVYAVDQFELVVKTAAGASVKLSTNGNSVEAEQVNCTWNGSPDTLDDALSDIKDRLDTVQGGLYTITQSGGATPSFEFDPDVDVNVFVCTHGGAVTAITVTWPSPGPSLEPGKRFSIIFQFPSGTTYSGTITWSGGNIVETNTTKLLTSSADRMWTADFIKTPAGGALVQATQWTDAQGSLWVL